MKIIKTVTAAFSMFTILPMPQHAWDDENTKYMLAIFPLVGAVQGFLIWGVEYICDFFAFPPLFRSILLLLTPILYTGGIHLDGFMDVSDALSSREDREKRLKIMTDPHIGAFAVIALAVYLLLDLGFWTSMQTFKPVFIILISMFSRSLAGFVMLTFPAAKSSGLAAYFSKAGSKSAAGALAAVISIFISIVLIFNGIEGICILISALVMLIIYLRVSKNKFGGITGDLSGWFLSLAELVMLGTYVVASYL